MQPFSRRNLLALCGFTPLAFAKTWDSRPFPAWSDDFVDKILTDSPWAKSSTAGFELPDEPRPASSPFAQIGFPGAGGWPSGGRGVSIRAEMYLTTRWASALPLRQAAALHEFGPKGLESPRALELLNRREPGYVIEIPGFPVAMIRQGAAGFETDLAKSAMLTVPGRQPVRAASARVPEHGMHLMATIRFPRFEELTVADNYVEFTAETRFFKLRERFKLKTMVYGGELEL